MLPLALTVLLAGPAAAGEREVASAMLASRPVLRRLVVKGADDTRPALVRAEIPLREGDTLDESRLRETRRRLEETGLFREVTLQVLPAGPGQADLEVLLEDRTGFAGLVPSLARAGLDLTRHRITARYSNVAGAGVSLGGIYRWERTQPSLGFDVQAVNPFGIGANLHFEALRARPTYDLEDDGVDPFTLRTRGVDLAARRVLGSRTTAELGLHLRDRTYFVARPDTPSGLVSGLRLGLEHRLVDAPRHRLDVSFHAMSASRAWGSDVEFTRGLGRVVYRALLSPPEAAVAVPRAELAVQLHVGHSGPGTPLDEMFAPGGASEAPLPLRAHRQKRSGVLGRTPIGRTLVLGNVELRRRLFGSAKLQVGGVVFYDVGRIGAAAAGRDATLHDIGTGVRLGLGRSIALRVDFGYGLMDGKTALTAGVGQVF